MGASVPVRCSRCPGLGADPHDGLPPTCEGLTAVFAHVTDGKIAGLWEIVDTAVLREQLGEPLR
jgi:hypothetical protein